MSLPQYKNRSLKVYNTATHLVYIVRSSRAIADLVFDGTLTGLGVPANTDIVYFIPLPFGWQACEHTNPFIASRWIRALLFSLIM